MARQKKQKKVVTTGIANIKTTFNNTIITICDTFGNALCWASTGIVGFKGTRQKTAYAAQLAAKNVATKANEFGMKKVEIVLRGRGNGKETSIRTLNLSGLKILSVEDKTFLPHNGCRPPKRRRL
jgi:small subunit ribosomal protein S11